jgi:hypothetical protein
MGKLLFTTLAMIVEFEADLTRLRTREGMKITKAKGRLQGKAPKLSATQEAHPGRPAQCRRTHQRRAGRAVRRGPLDGLPRDRARLCSGGRNASLNAAGPAAAWKSAIGDPQGK